LSPRRRPRRCAGDGEHVLDRAADLGADDVVAEIGRKLRVRARDDARPTGSQWRASPRRHPRATSRQRSARQDGERRPGKRAAALAHQGRISLDALGTNHDGGAGRGTVQRRQFPQMLRGTTRRTASAAAATQLAGRGNRGINGDTGRTVGFMALIDRATTSARAPKDDVAPGAARRDGQRGAQAAPMMRCAALTRFSVCSGGLYSPAGAPERRRALPCAGREIAQERVTAQVPRLGCHHPSRRTASACARRSAAQRGRRLGGARRLVRRQRREHRSRDSRACASPLRAGCRARHRPARSSPCQPVLVEQAELALRGDVAGLRAWVTRTAPRRHPAARVAVEIELAEPPAASAEPASAALVSSVTAWRASGAMPSPSW